MNEDIEKELGIPKLRSYFLRYTKAAFEVIPEIGQAKILDIGCGSGSSTLELATLFNYEIHGIDIDQQALGILKKEIAEKKLSQRIKVYNSSLLDAEFSDDSYDILWEEGVLHLIDLHQGFSACTRLLKPKGFLVMAERDEWFESNKAVFLEQKYYIFHKIQWARKCWWDEYYSPLEKQINQVRKKCKTPRNLQALKRYEDEVVMVKANPNRFDCSHFILRKES